MSLTKDNWILSPELLKLVKVSRDLFGRFCLALPCLVLAILQIKYKKQLIYLDLLLDYILSLSCLEDSTCRVDCLTVWFWLINID